MKHILILTLLTISLCGCSENQQAKENAKKLQAIEDKVDQLIIANKKAEEAAAVRAEVQKNVRRFQQQSESDYALEKANADLARAMGIKRTNGYPTFYKR